MQSTIYIVDDDSAVRTSLARSLKHHGNDVVTFDSAMDFLADLNHDSYGCIILDIAMPEMSGLEVQSKLITLKCKIPIIFMTGHGDVPTSVRALKNGAIEFLEKPFAMDFLLERINHALEAEKKRFTDTLTSSEILQKFSSLTNREVDVMTGLTTGFANYSNKEIARELDISYRTVEVYRSRIMEKMAASSITHLVAIAKVCGIHRDY